MANGFLGSGSAAGSGGFLGGSNKSQGKTKLQQTELKFIKNQGHHSFLGKLFHGATHGVEGALQFVARPSYAIAGAADAAVQHKDILHAAGLGIEGKSHIGFGQVLDHAGLLKGHGILRGIAGFGLDIATDPTILASIAAAPITGGASLSLIAEKEAAMGLERGALSAAAKTVLDGKASINELKAARDTLRSAGSEFALSKGLGDLRIREARAVKAGKPYKSETQSIIQAQAEAANVEINQSLGPRYLRLKYGTNKHNVSIGTKIKAPSLRAAADSTRLANIWGLSTIPKIAQHIGNAVKPGFDNPKFHAMDMVGVRIVEHLNDQNVKTIAEHIRPFYQKGSAQKLSTDDIFHALHWGETHPGIVTGVGRTLNASMLTKATKAIGGKELTKTQAAFLTAWHQATEHLRINDQEWGVHYTKPLGDVIYVPHIYTKGGGPILAAASHLTKKGFEYARLTDKPNSVMMLKELHDSGVYRKELETDPLALLAMRSRRGAQANAEQKLREIAAATGIPTRRINNDKYAERLLQREARRNNLATKYPLVDPLNLQKAYDAASRESVTKWAAQWQKSKAIHTNNVAITKSKIRNLKKQIKEFKGEFKGTKLETRVSPNMLNYRLRQQEQSLALLHTKWGEKQLKLHSKKDLRTGHMHLQIEAKALNQATRQAGQIRELHNLDRKLIKDLHTNPSLYERNPAAYQPGLAVVDKLKHFNGSELAVSADLAAALKRTSDAVSNDQFLQDFSNTWRKLIAKWKLGVTVVNPGYRVRNTMSDLWNMYAKPNNHVPLWAMGAYGTRAANMILRPTEEGNKRLLEAFNGGIFAGLFQGDIERVVKYFHGNQSTKRLVKSGHAVQATTQLATKFNRNAENWGRLTHYLYLRDHLGMNAVDAAHDVRATHFDYEDLTPTERKLKANFIPFLTWTRKNIPFQITSLIQAPGKYATFSKFINESEYASGDNTGQLIPSWMKQSLGFHVPFGPKGTMLIPQIGPTDLTKLEHPLSGLTSLVTPPIKDAAEIALNKSFLTGGPIYGSQLSHPLTPTSILGKYLPGSGTTSRNVRGKKITGPGANPFVTYAAGQNPISNLLVNQLSNINRAKRGKSNAFISELGGLSLFNPDQQAQLAGLNVQEKDAFKQFVRGLRDRGKLPEPKKKKLSPYGLQRQGAIAANG